MSSREEVMRLVLQWLDMERLADSLDESEGADTIASQDTDELARGLRGDVEEAVRREIGRRLAGRVETAEPDDDR